MKASRTCESSEYQERASRAHYKDDDGRRRELLATQHVSTRHAPKRERRQDNAGRSKAVFAKLAIKGGSQPPSSCGHPWKTTARYSKFGRRCVPSWQSCRCTMLAGSGQKQEPFPNGKCRIRAPCSCCGISGQGHRFQHHETTQNTRSHTSRAAPSYRSPASVITSYLFISWRSSPQCFRLTQNPGPAQNA